MLVNSGCKPRSEEEKAAIAAGLILRRRRAQETFVDFCRELTPDELPAKHHVVLCEALDEVAEGLNDRLMVFMPPGSAKSTYASKKFPAYFLGKYSNKNIICGSYGEGLSTTFGKAVRNIVNSREYNFVFNTQLSEDSRAKGEWDTKDGGSYYAVGVGSGVTGRRSDLNLIDDPVKGRKDADSQLVRDEIWNWYLADFLTRLKPGGAQVIVQTRWHEDDLSGRILPQDWNFQSGTFIGFDGQPWKVICIPAQAEKNDILGRKEGEYLWTDYMSVDWWEKTKATQTATDMRNWSALYQQRPQPDSGVYFKREWFDKHRYKEGEHPPVNYYGASDYAVTSGGGDWTEHGIAGFDKDKHIWVKDWWSGQETSDVWIEEQIRLARTYQPFVWLSEVGVIRRSTEPYLLKRQYDVDGEVFRMEWLPHIGNKGAHCRSFQAMASQGMVHIPYTEWGDELINELVKFIPDTNFKDDKADVCGHFGRYVHKSFAHNMVKEEKKTVRDSYGFDEESDKSWKIA
jgi:predicted phage terminase large subunit-like protein